MAYKAFIVVGEYRNVHEECNDLAEAEKSAEKYVKEYTRDFGNSATIFKRISEILPEGSIEYTTNIPESVKHDAQLSFAFYNIKSETEQLGTTTRPDKELEPDPDKAA